MNIFLWVLQIVIALHTFIGAVWKFSHSAEQTMSSLKAIPNGVWMAMGGFEVLCSLALILPVFRNNLGFLAPIAAIGIAVEMLGLSGVHFYFGDTNYGPIIYWLVVATICAFVAYGRFVLKPL